MSSPILSGTLPPVLFLILIAIAFIAGCTSTDSWTATDWMEQGNRLAKESLYADAIIAYNQSITHNPSDAKVWTYRGVALQHLGDHQSAMQDFDHALSIDPAESGAWQGKSASFIETGQYRTAIKAADRAIELTRSGDKIENSYLLKGFALNRLESYDDALLAFDKAIEIDPKRLDLWQNKAYTLTKLGRYVEVLKCYEVMTEIEPDNPEIWNKKGEIHLALGQINEANMAFSIAKNLIKGS